MLARSDRYGGTALERATDALVRSCGLSLDVARQVVEFAPATKLYSAGALIQTSAPSDLVWILDGWACETCDLADGRRQIASFALPGDVVRAQARTGPCLRAFTLVEVIEVGDLFAEPGAPPSLHEALLRSVALARHRKYEHLVRLTTRAPLNRLASLLVDLHDRLEAVRLAAAGEFSLPLRHRDIGDALGVSALHITRCLGVLRQQKLLTSQFRRVSDFDRDGLLQFVASGFNRP